MSIPVYSRSDSQQMNNCYFHKINTNSKEVRCISCNEGRKIDIFFSYEEGKQQQRYKDVLFIVNAILTGSSFVCERQLECLKRIRFHKCTLHRECKLPNNAERRALFKLIEKVAKIESCETCRNEQKCEIGQCDCLFENNNFLPIVSFL